MDDGSKLNLSKSPDVDVLKTIILKLQKRVEAGATTLLIKVRTHRGDPLNEESDIRSELGHLKEYKETIWNDSSTELCINGPPPPQHTGGQQFSRLRYGLILCTITLGRKREK